MFEVITLYAYIRNDCKNTKKLSFAGRFPHLISWILFIRGVVVESKSVQKLMADWYYGFVYGIQLSITQKRLYLTNVRYSLTGTLEFSVQL